MKRRGRNERGSMLVLVILAMCVVCLIVAQLSGFAAMLLAHEKLMDQTEQSEMRAVEILNENDRSGRINLMTASARELVFDSRRLYNGVAYNCPSYARLAQYYLDQSRDGARLVSQEREKIIACEITEERALAADIDKKNRDKKLLPCGATSGSCVYALELGYSKGEDSNVQATPQDPDLFAFDEANQNFDRDTKLYHGNTSLSLPGPDCDLEFKLSSLPAPVSGTPTQARIDDGKKFVSTLPLIRDGELASGKCEYLPSRARLILVEKFQNTVGVTCHERIAATASGTTYGGGDQAI